MKLVLFSDIHGNADALNVFLCQIQNLTYDHVIFCGDIFGYYYDQKKIIKMLSDMSGLIWLKGNHDVYFLKLCGLDCEKRTEAEQYYIENYGHSYENLSLRYDKEEIELVASHASEFLLEEESNRIGIFHGTPENSLEGRLYPDQPILKADAYDPYDIVILGHTHCRMVRMEGHTLVINPGSLGQPRDGKGYSYALLDTNIKEVKFCTVTINEKKLYEKIDSYDPGLKKLKEVLERRCKDEEDISYCNQR